MPRPTARSASKLISAGGGRFLMFYTEEATRLHAPRHAARKDSAKSVSASDFEGTKIVAQD